MLFPPSGYIFPPCIQSPEKFLFGMLCQGILSHSCNNRIASKRLWAGLLGLAMAIFDNKIACTLQSVWKRRAVKIQNSAEFPVQCSSITCTFSWVVTWCGMCIIAEFCQNLVLRTNSSAPLGFIIEILHSFSGYIALSKLRSVGLTGNVKCLTQKAINTVAERVPQKWQPLK